MHIATYRVPDTHSRSVSSPSLFRTSQSIDNMALGGGRGYYSIALNIPEVNSAESQGNAARTGTADPAAAPLATAEAKTWNIFRDSDL